MNKPIIAQMENGGGLIEAPEPDFKTLLDADLERIMAFQEYLKEKTEVETW